MSQLPKQDVFLSKKVIRKFLILIGFSTLLLIAIPIGLYFYKFGFDQLSNEQSVWGTFGDFIGGTVGTVFSLLATVLSLISIYITLKIAEILQNSDQNKREDDIKFLHLQHMPVAHVGVIQGHESFEVIINNFGLGPLTNLKWHLIKNNNTYYSMDHFIEELCPPLINCHWETDNTRNNSIPPGKKVTLLLIKKSAINIEPYLDQVMKSFENVEVILNFKDIFNKEIEYKKDFGNVNELKNMP